SSHARLSTGEPGVSILRLALAVRIWHRLSLVGGAVCVAIFSCGSADGWGGEWIRKPGIGNGNRRTRSMVGHERRGADFRVEGSAHAERVAVVSARVHDFLLRVLIVLAVHIS